MMVMAMEMMMMIPMKFGVKVMAMAMISPLRKGISPTDFSLPESFLSLSVLFPSPRRRRNIFSIALPILRVLEEEVWEGATPEVGQGLLTRPRRDQGVPRGGVGPSWPITASPFGWLRLLMK